MFEKDTYTKMATKVREISIKESKGTFSLFKKAGISKSDYDFSGIQALRQLLSNEKARVLNVIKTEKPGSIYELAKKLNRGFKSVMDDIKLLERFGFIELIAEKTKNRVRHRPEVVVDSITINIKF
jgi:predicted transcriptional regulator